MVGFGARRSSRSGSTSLTEQAGRTEEQACEHARPSDLQPMARHSARRWARSPRSERDAERCRCRHHRNRHPVRPEPGDRQPTIPTSRAAKNHRFAGLPSLPTIPTARFAQIVRNIPSERRKAPPRYDQLPLVRTVSSSRTPTIRSITPKTTKSLNVQRHPLVNCIAMNGSASSATAPPQPIAIHGIPPPALSGLLPLLCLHALIDGPICLPQR